MALTKIPSTMLETGASGGSAYVFDVKAYGAAGDNVTDDTAAIQAAIDAAKLAGRGCVFLPDGRYRISAPLNVDFSNFSIRGSSMWTSTIVTNQSMDMLRFNFSANNLNFMQAIDLGFLYDGVSAQTYGSAIRMYTSQETPAYGGTHHNYQNLLIRAVKAGIIFDEPHYGLWNGIAQIADYGHLMFDNIHIPYNNDFTEIGILFRGGPGAHNTFSRGSMQTKTVCIRMGNNTTNVGVGDQLFEGLHLLNADYAIDIFGPTGAGRYNENVTISGCQFDGIAEVTVRANYMSNLRIKNCNSTNAATYDLYNSSGYSIEQTGQTESLYSFSARTLTSGVTSVPVFVCSLSDVTDNYTSALLEVFVDAFVGGVGARAAVWRGFVRYSNGTASFHEAELYNAGLTGLTITPSVIGSTVQFTATISGSTSNGKIDAQARVVGRNIRCVSQ